MYTKTKNLIKFEFPVIVVVLCIVLFFQYIPVSSPQVVLAQATSGTPLRIFIPRVHVNASIEAVSLNSNGLADSPQIALNTGWDNSTPKPGEEGNAVIYGYVHWKYGYTARFADLHFLMPGDMVYVTDDRGVTTSFSILASKTYSLDADVTAVSHLEDDGAPYLTLVTYDGSWDELSESYSRRLVIFAKKEITSMTADVVNKNYGNEIVAFGEIHDQALMMPEGSSYRLMNQFLKNRL